MRASTLIITALTHFTAFGRAIPILSDNPVLLAARGRHCDNAPSVVAGAFLENPSLRSEGPKLGPRVQDTSPAVWCGFGSKTYISVDYVSDIHDQSWNGVDDFLDSVAAVIRNEIRTAGDGLIPGGLITYKNAGLLLRSQNANNHQQTWGVLGSGVSALSDYMIDQKNQGYTPSFVTFLLYDGPNQVANATFSPRTLYGQVY